jgi:conjugative transfer pilus assembly protein TraH
MHRLLSLVALLLGLAVGLGTPSAANAQGIQQQMETTFGSMVSVTEPRIVTDSTRGVISGGNFTVKNKITTADIISFRLPSIQAGCGGWDIFGGSFSFISSEQIVAMLRGIAASAVAYAFKLAIDAISDDIGNALDGLWNNQVFSNFMGKNSCEMGKALVDAMMSSGSSTKSNQKATNNKVEKGDDDDHTEGQNNMKADSPAAEEARKDPAYREAIVQGNQIFRALREQGIDSWSGFGGRAFIEDIMAVTGTVIVCVPNVDGCPSNEPTDPALKAGQQDVVMMTRVPLSGLSELVKGRLGNSNFKYWECNNATTCLDPKEKTRGNYRGTEEMLRTVLLGPNNLPGEGLIGRYAQNLDTPTAQEQGIITAGGSFVAMAMQLAVHNERDARDFVDVFAEIIAAELTYRVLNEALGKAAAAAAALEAGEAKEAQEFVRRARLAITEELKKFHTNNVMNTSKWEYFQGVKAARPAVKVPAISVSSGK